MQIYLEHPDRGMDGSTLMPTLEVRGPPIIEAQKAWKNVGGLEIITSFFQGNWGGGLPL